MHIGHLKQKAHPILVYFVFCCILITTGLLYLVQKSEAKATHLTSIGDNKDYYDYPY